MTWPETTRGRCAMREWLREFAFRPGFLRKYPYYASVLARMEPIADPTVDVMGVSAHGGRFYLHVNLEFFVATPQFVTGVLLHEVHHVVLGHLTHPRYRDIDHPNIMELAMEVSANEYIREELPGAPLTWSDFRRQGLQPDQSTLERYRLLVEQAAKGPPLVQLAGPWVDDHHRMGIGSIYTDHMPSPGEREMTRRLIDEAVEEAERRDGTPRGRAGLMAGKEPGHLIESLTGARDPSQPPPEPQNWKAALQMFAGMVRAPVHTFARPNRRFPSRVGVIPGRVYFPSVSKKPTLIVAVDTSASMSRDELMAIAAELRSLHGLTKITVVECDARIQRVYRFTGELTSVAGRGGTDLRPIFAPEFLAQHRPDGVIYFTDGCGPYPEREPRIKTLWILSKPIDFDCPWGVKSRFPRLAGGVGGAGAARTAPRPAIFPGIRGAPWRT